MKCPFCGELDTQVRDSRQIQEGNIIKRRRACIACDARFTTLERIESQAIYVIKKEGSKKLFDQEKLRRSVALASRKRDVSDEQIRQLVDKIILEIQKSGEYEITTKRIGELVMEQLAQIDDVAYV